MVEARDSTSCRERHHTLDISTLGVEFPTPQLSVCLIRPLQLANAQTKCGSSEASFLADSVSAEGVEPRHRVRVVFILGSFSE
jgi:hypothetical protein